MYSSHLPTEGKREDIGADYYIKKTNEENPHKLIDGLYPLTN